MMFSPASPFLPPILFRSIFANKISSEASVLEKRWPAVNATTPGTLVPDHGPDLEPLPPVASPLPTCEAARTQRSLAAKAETMSIPGPEGSAYLAAMRPPRPLHEAPKPRIHQQPIRIQAPTKLEGSRSRSRARDPAVQRARRARHRPAHERASRPSERRMAARLAFPLRKRGVGPFGSQSPLIRRLLSPCIRRAGLSPTPVPGRALTRSPAQISSPPICLPV